MQNFGSVKCIIQKDFSSFKALCYDKVLQYFDFRIFMVFNSHNLWFKSYRKTFVTFLKFSSLDIFFNVLKTNFIIGVNQKWLEDLERYLHFFATGRAFSKRQDFRGLLRRYIYSATIDNINFECDIFLSWITGTNLQWHKTKNICSKKMIGLISLYIILEEFLAIITTLHVFSVQWIFANTFLMHSQFFERCERNNMFWQIQPY